MSNIVTQSRAARFISVLLITLLIVTAMPVNMWQVHAASESITVDKETYVQGEPIYVTATGSTSARVSITTKGDDPSSDYWIYYYVNNQKFNIYDGDFYDDNAWNGMLPPGDYTATIVGGSGSQPANFSIVEGDVSTRSLEIEKESYVEGDSVRVKATSLDDNNEWPWVGLYAGTAKEDGEKALQYYYTIGNSGVWYDLGVLPAGDYTVILFNDYDGKSIAKEVDFTVKESEVEIDYFSTNKTHYDIDEPIIVTANYEYGDKDWVGLYKKGEVVGDALSFKYDYFKSYEGSFDIYKSKYAGEPARTDFTPGEYTLILCANDSYGVLDTVDITIGHTYGEWKFDGADKKTHTRTCDGVLAAEHPETEPCDFETADVEGGVKYTCSVCKGTFVEAHHYEYTCNGDKTHSAKCTDEGCNAKIENENCTLDAGKREGDKAVFNCSVCKGESKVPLFVTDKTEYKYGEPIMVTWNHKTADNDWIGIYKRGETYDPNAGGVKSIYWYYVGQDGYSNPVDIRATRNENNRSGEFVAGEYTIVMFEKGSYTDIASIDITITKDVVSEVQTTAPTCENAGEITITYTDGTTDTKPVDKLGHKYPETWSYDGASKKTHSRVCGNDASHVDTDNCDFELTATTEAKPGVKGEKLFTCKVCEGTYTEEIPALGVEPTGETEVIKEATCEEKGTLRVFYNDGSYIDEDIPAKKHAYPDTWTHVEGTNTHQKVCANDKNHVQTGNCEFETVSDSGIITETCTACGNTVVTTILSTDKTEYCFGEAIMVSFDAAAVTEKGWVGLYEADAKYGPETEAGTVKSVAWDNVSVDAPFNLIDAEADRLVFPERYNAGGEYKVVLFKDGGYTAVAETRITIGCEYGDWTFNEAGADSTHSRVCAKNETHVDTQACTWDEGTAVDGGTKYTCEVCKGSYVETHHYTYKYNDDKATHVKSCKDAGCEFTAVTEDCSWSAKEENGVATYTCDLCGGSYTETWISTDKKVYDMYEPIMITVDYELGDKDWVGIYKKGEVPQDQVPTPSPVSFFYYYPAQGVAQNIYDGKSQENSVQSETIKRGYMEPGEYTIYLCENDGFNVITSIDVTVTHEFGDWAPTADRTVKDNCEHAKVCDGILKHEEKEKCTFGEGVQTKAPTATEAGTLTFTCTVCGGTYVEVLPALGDKVVSDVTTPATCEEPSIRTITYESGIVKTEEVAPALGHDYDKDTAKFDEATKTHSVACKNDKTHIKSEDCNFETVSVKDGTVTHKCTVCGGTFESGLLYVEKDTYAASDNIDVIATCDAKDSWVGLYGIDEKADPNNGGVVSYYWYTVTGDGIDRSGKKITLTDFYNEERREGLTPGEYKIVLFGDGKYSNVLAEKQITITESKTTYEVKMKDKVVADGETVAYDSKDSIKVNVTSDGNPGQAWVGIYPGKYDKSHDFSTTTSTQWYKISEYNGKDFTVTSQDLKEDGIYTVAVFGDGAYSNIKHMSYYTVTEEGLTEEIIEQPTCTKPGVKKVLYEGDTEPTYVPIPALGHDIELVYDKDAKTHSGECTRCDYVADGEPCTFDEGVVTDNIKTYTCTKCGGQYTEEAEKPLPPYTEENGRVAGNDRFDTALEAAEQLKKTLEVEKFENIIIASGMDYADALSGTYLAKVKNAPILLINGKSDAVMKEVAEYAKANLKDEGTIYILGGEVAVPAKFNTYIDSENIKVARLAGKNRYETNLAILQEAGVEGKDVLVCTGTNFADSLSASASGKAILLVGSTLDTKQKEFLGGLKDKKYYILGGTVAISNTLEDSIRAFGGTERISGKDRFETSVKFAEKFFENPKAAVLTYGLNFPDGLAGGVLAMSMDAPLILTAANNDTFAKEYTKANNIVSGVVLGGTKLISEAAAMSIFNVAK